MLLSSIVVPSYASSVSLSVSLFAGSTYSAVTNYYNYTSSTTYVYALKTPAYCGVRITIPASNVGGYLISAGYMPANVHVNSSGVTSGWGTIKSQTNNSYMSSYYYLSSNANAYLSADGLSDVFSGVIYIPAHNNVLYLYLYNYVSTNANYYTAVYVSNGAFASFVPDSDGSSDSAQQQLQQLQQINNNIKNIYNEISNDSELANAEALLDQMEKLTDTIEDMSQQLQEIVARPPAESIIPSIGDALTPSDEASELGMDALSSAFSFRPITILLGIVLTFAIVRYVLYGKAGG